MAKFNGFSSVSKEFYEFASSVGVDSWCSESTGQYMVAEPYHMVIWQLLAIDGAAISRNSSHDIVRSLKQIRPQVKHIVKKINLDAKLRDALVVCREGDLITDDDLRELLASLIKDVTHKA